MEMKGVLGSTCNLQVQTREYDEGGDVYKSLDSIVNERGYVKPPSYKSGGDNTLPITGRRAIVPSIRSNLDPMANSLDDMIVKPQPASDRSGRGKSITTIGGAVVNSNLDPMSNSLDAIIKSGKASRNENGGGRDRGGPHDKKKRFRDEFENKDGLNEEDDSTTGNSRGKRKRFTGKLTPYRAVTYLSEKLMIIEVKCGKKVEFTEENTPQKWRCTVKCGELEGIADSSRKVVARELACQEFLKLLKEAFPEGKIPEYELSPDIFLDPKVYKAIEKEGAETGFDISFEISMDNKFGGTDGERLPFFKCVYELNGSEFFGRSTDRNFAQLKAAMKVYEAMTGRKFPLTKYFTGEDCDPNVEYDFSESEVHSFAVGSAGMLTDEKMY